MIDFIKRRLRIYINNKHKQGYHIHGVLCVGVSDFEKDFLKNTDFIYVKDYRDGEKLYELDELGVKAFIRSS